MGRGIAERPGGGKAEEGLIPESYIIRVYGPGWPQVLRAGLPFMRELDRKGELMTITGLLWSEESGTYMCIQE